MGVKIHPIPLGMNRCYVIQDRGAIMIDGGVPRKAGAFKQALGRLAIEPGDIQLLVISHGHFDHTGSATEIKEITGAQIAMHRADEERLREGTVAAPPGVTGWGKILSAFLKPAMSLLQFPAPQVDLVLDDDEFSLDEYGVPGRVIHTPGHTPGSVSVLLDTGDAFVGCMAHNNLPFRLGPGLPILAEDLHQLRESWRRLLALGAETIYPGHGEPFPADVMRKAL